MATISKCDTCCLRYHCDEQTEFICKFNYYCKFIPDEEKPNTSDVVKVQHGKWEVAVGMNFFKERNCPVCKKRIESNFWNYCPNCGTKMYI